MKVINDALISDITSYKLSGKISKLVFPSSVSELKDVLKSTDKYKIVGFGSNLIISESYDGVIIKLSELNEISFNKNIVCVGCGYSLSKLSMECAKKDLSGLEFACGIPGSIGGAVYMNAGAYGMSISDVLSKVWVLDGTEIKELGINDLNFDYRNSVFKGKNYVILKAEFVLNYKDSDLILDDVKQIMNSRREKQPLEFPSAGSVFRNPEGYSAGRLIEKAGIKGMRVGDAEVSLKHANFIVNRGNASAEDVIQLISKVKKIVKDKFDVILEEEQEIVR